VFWKDIEKEKFKEEILKTDGGNEIGGGGGGECGSRNKMG
jgi:hypothetical protein